MDILIQADGVTLTQAIKDAIDEKMGHVEQYAPRAVRARVRLRKVSADLLPANIRCACWSRFPARTSAPKNPGPR